MLEHETPLSGYSRKIGGSSGKGTHGSTVAKPDGMPNRKDADYRVTSPRELRKAMKDDNAIVYVTDDIDIAEQDTIWCGDGLTLISDYCNPNVSGTGPVIRHRRTDNDVYTRKCFAHTGGKPIEMYGVYAHGPRTDYFDADHNAPEFDEITSTFLHEYAPDSAGVFKAAGCRFTGWTLAGLELGAKGYETRAEIRRSTFERNRAEHLGYGVELYNGHLSVRDSFFDANRHSIAGFGYPTCGYAVADSVFGPDTVSHVLDMHSLANSLSDGDETAGAYLRAYQCSFMPTVDELGRAQEGIAIRGEPVESDPASYADKCHFWHEAKPTPTGDQGSAYRQETREWVNFEPRDNHFGSSQKDGYGAPRAKKPVEDEPEPQPEQPDEPTMTKQLNVHATSGPGEYRIVVEGDAEPGPKTEANDVVNDNGDGKTEITGEIWGGTDTYELADDAKPIYAVPRARVKITLDGTDITSELIGPGLARELDNQQSTIDKLRSRLESVKLVWGDSK